MVTLLSKRFLIFYRRYILAITMLLFPVTLQIIICLLIPSSTVLHSSKSAVPVKNLGNLKLKVDKYGDTNLPYSIAAASSGREKFEQLLKEFYARHAPRVGLQRLEEISNAVFLERKRDFSSIYSRNFLGNFKLLNQLPVRKSSMLKIIWIKK